MRIDLTATAAVVVLVLTGPVADAANCALRSPSRQIQQMCPESSNYRSVVASISPQIKSLIEKRLGIRLAVADLGKHTIYVALNDGVPVKFVHARSRERNSAVIRDDAFRHKLVGLEAVHDIDGENRLTFGTSHMHGPRGLRIRRAGPVSE